MAWHRGFVICPDSELAAVRTLLETQANASLLTTLSGEVALAFTSRIIPELGQHQALVIGVDYDVVNYFHVRSGNYSPAHLVPRIGLTFGLVVARDCHAMQSGALQIHIEHLGQPSDQGEEDGLLGLRWDLECGIDDQRIQSFTHALKEIESALIEAGEPHRIATFEGWFGKVCGELEEVGDVWGCPIAIMVVEWPGQSGDTSRVTANDSEFVVEGDDIADSELL